MLLNTFSEHIAMALSNLRLREVLRNQAIRDPLTGFSTADIWKKLLSAR